MALGDGIRRNIAHVDPAERALLRDAIIELNHRYFPGSPGDTLPGSVSWWFKQDEIHQATHLHGGPEFQPPLNPGSHLSTASISQMIPKPIRSASFGHGTHRRASWDIPAPISFACCHTPAACHRRAGVRLDA
jgi:hypothetical protein